jgi:hypothetical protein
MGEDFEKALRVVAEEARRQREQRYQSRAAEVELAECKAKLARVEATLMSDWCKAAGYVHRADDFGRLHAELRNVLLGKP